VKPRPGSDDTLLGRASRALGWSFLSVALVRLGTFGIGVVLARLLGPQAFGTYAVALVAQLALISFNELGVSLAIVRWPGDPREIAPTVQTIACASSLILYAGFFLGAPAFAGAMGAPAATPVIRVLAIGVIIDGVVSVPAAMMQRSFSQDRKLVADQIHSWLGAAVSICLAVAGFGAMSLAVGAVVGAVAGGLVIMKFSPPPRFGFDASKARALLAFGLPLAGSSFVVFLVGNVDNFIVGRLLGATALGFYVLAWNLSSWPVTMFSMPVRAVAPAMFSRLQHDKAAMRKGFQSVVGMLTSVTLPVCLLMAGSSVPLVEFVYGSQWIPAAQALPWLALLAALRILFELSYDFFVVLARARVVFTVQLAWLVALIPALIVGVRQDGIRGAAIAGFAVAACVVLPWYLIELHRAAIRLRALAARVWIPIVAAAGVSLLPKGLGGVITNSLTILLIGGVAALGTISLLILRLQPELVALRSTFAESSEPATAESSEPATAESSEPATAESSEPATAESMQPAVVRSGGSAIAAFSEAATIEFPVPLISANGEPATLPKYVGRHRGTDLLRAAAGRRTNGNTPNGPDADELAALRPHAERGQDGDAVGRNRQRPMDDDTIPLPVFRDMTSLFPVHHEPPEVDRNWGG
jgi:O-antigen/teichoic acid export membrane protein